MPRFFFLLFLLLPSYGCLIVVLTDGRRVLVGNHEDWYGRDAEIVFIPATPGKYGMVVFDFASEGYAQGGMNSKGLFFDGTATPYVQMDGSDKPAFTGYIWQALLERCASVEEGLNFLKQYQLPELQEVHILLADRSGASVIIGAYDGELTFHYRERSFQILTNFNVADPGYGGEPPCPRYGTAMRYLEADSTATVENLQNLLADTHQGELTVYSNIYDLTEGVVHVYSLADFERRASFDLDEELAKGRRTLSVPALFD